MSTIEPYTGRTWVGFLDICGFKSEMAKGNENARLMLNKFYNKVHQIKQLYNGRIVDFNTIELNVLSVSDCAIIFTRNNTIEESDKISGLVTILNFVKLINTSLIKNPKPRILTNCSIAYGNFNFESRNLTRGISKEFFYGEAYLKAYLDNANSDNKLQPGECRVIINKDDPVQFDDDRIFSYVKEEKGHYYYYWMLNNPEYISTFKEAYNIDTYEFKKNMLNNFINKK